MKTYLASIVLITWIIAFYNLKLSLKNDWNPNEFNSSRLKYIYTMKLHRYMLLLVHNVKWTYYLNGILLYNNYVRYFMSIYAYLNFKDCW